MLTLSLMNMRRAQRRSGNPSLTISHPPKPPTALVQDFITQVKTLISQLHEVGITLPKDIIAQQITHSEKEITPELVLDHLRLYMNDQHFLALNNSTKTFPTSLLTNESQKCKKGWHNPNAAHPKANCWFLYPHLRPTVNSGEASVSSFHSSISKLMANFILDSGSSSHMVSDINLFITIDFKEQGVVRTSSGQDSLKIKGIGTIKLSNEFGNLILNQVLYVPNLFINLLYKVNLPCLNFRSHEEKYYLSASELLHKSLGHVSYHRIRQKLGIPLQNTVSFEDCALSKITQASFKHKHKKASWPFEELHLDLIGPISPTLWKEKPSQDCECSAFDDLKFDSRNISPSPVLFCSPRRMIR
ncbi:hypothetical protein VP01_2003g5 [Puccinia sorghi]|uniref:Retrovirus-related Pol polyprotein from transposon TNT 1-94-like beta-barrel domain-containing protein n=1 Tax=Puccinia sorghi TaxID=27349 RepID=A0A0L6VD77_9BASI|nr:hypothetical protein VP01_2003g5 [Puccinia sorghi]